MIGGIAGDIIGSRFEWDNIKSKEFELFVDLSVFTDDSVLTVAIADALLGDRDYASYLRRYGREYFGRGYGAMFQQWLDSEDLGPYGSYGNGSAMRVGPVGYAFDTLEETLAEAGRSAAVTHDHPEGIAGAQSVAAVIFMARTGHDKDSIRSFVSERFCYDLTRSVDAIRESYGFDESCQGTVPEAITCFLESEDYEDAVRNAISIGGDSDTLACITGSMAEAFYGGVPDHVRKEVENRIPAEFIDVMRRFKARYSRLEHSAPSIVTRSSQKN